MLHIICGLPGSGKTEAARYLASRLPALCITLDDVFKLLFPNSANHRIYGDYSSSEIDSAYASLRPVLYYLALENSSREYVLDGVFRLRTQIDSVCNFLRTIAIPFRIIQIISSHQLSEIRIEVRLRAGKSHATVDAFRRIVQLYEVPSQTTHVIENNSTIEHMYDQLDEYLELLTFGGGHT
jgi:predicted kinase